MLVILLCMSVITGLGLRLQLLCRRGHYPVDVEASAGPSKLICASMDRIYGGVVNAPDGNGNGVSRCNKSVLFSSTFASKEARRRFRSGYESKFIPLAIRAFSQQGGTPSHMLIGLPLLTHIPGAAWLAKAEADLEGNSVMYLTGGGPQDIPGKGQFRLETVLAPRFDDQPSYPTAAVVGRLPHYSAGRVLQVADTPGALIESNIINDLNPPVVLEDTSWIHPGRHGAGGMGPPVRMGKPRTRPPGWSISSTSRLSPAFLTCWSTVAGLNRTISPR